MENKNSAIPQQRAAAGLEQVSALLKGEGRKAGKRREGCLIATTTREMWIHTAASPGTTWVTLEEFSVSEWYKTERVLSSLGHVKDKCISAKTNTATAALLHSLLPQHHSLGTFGAEPTAFGDGTNSLHP